MSKKLPIAILAFIVALGFALRFRGLDSAGFIEDEVHKIEAARSYLRGNFLVNLEHPMLMKSLISVSVTAADCWNRSASHAHLIPEEVAVRLPNVVFGALTAVVLFLVAREFFGFGVGILSALLWATGVFAISINRIAKEDTLLVFFTWLAFYLFLRARELSKTDVPGSERWFASSGASFGLMLASKYFPHYLGLNFLCHYLWGKMGNAPPRRWRNTLLVLGGLRIGFYLG
jgi:dolichyl-phosphate-mannose--protein O-mannosyl transferase